MHAGQDRTDFRRAPRADDNQEEYQAERSRKYPSNEPSKPAGESVAALWASPCVARDLIAAFAISHRVSPANSSVECFRVHVLWILLSMLWLTC